MRISNDVKLAKLLANLIRRTEESYVESEVPLVNLEVVLDKQFKGTINIIENFRFSCYACHLDVEHVKTGNPAHGLVVLIPVGGADQMPRLITSTPFGRGKIIDGAMRSADGVQIELGAILKATENIRQEGVRRCFIKMLENIGCTVE